MRRWSRCSSKSSSIIPRWKNGPITRRPAASAGEHLVAVDPGGFQGIGSHESDDAEADAAGPRHRSVSLVAVPREGQRIGRASVNTWPRNGKP